MANFRYKNLNMHYELCNAGGAGDRPVVVGLNAVLMNAGSWKTVLPENMTEFAFLTVDFFDQGRSERIPGADYSQTMQANALAALLDYLNILNPYVVGVSYGGQVAVTAHALGLVNFKAIVLVNCPHYHNANFKRKMDTWIEVAKMKDSYAFFDRVIAPNYSIEFRKNYPDVMIRQRKSMKNIMDSDEYESFVRLIRSSYDTDIRDYIAKVNVPILFAHGSQNEVFDSDDMVNFYSQFDNISIVELRNMGHGAIYENPDQLVFEIFKFLASNDQNLSKLLQSKFYKMRFD